MKLSILEFIELSGLTYVETVKLLDKGELIIELQGSRPAIILEASDFDDICRKAAGIHIGEYLESLENEKEEVVKFIEGVILDSIKTAQAKVNE